MFTILDTITIAGYIAILLIIGYRASRKETVEGFLIADRSMNVWEAMFTINATKTGSIILIYTTLLYDYGLSALWYFVGVVIGYLTFIPFAKVLHKQSGGTYYTLSEFFLVKFGVVANHATSIVSIIIMVGFLITNLIAAATVLAFYAHIPFVAAVGCTAFFVYLYLVMAGFKAVVRTDVFQYIAIVAILLLFLFPLSQGVHIPAEEWNVLKTGPGNVMGFMLFGILIPFASPDLWQRVYAMPSASHVSRSIIYSVLMYIPVCLVLTVIGLLIKSHLPDIDPNIALVQGFATLLPSGMRGLSVVIFFAAFMSTIDTLAFTASSSIVQDFWKKLSKKQMMFWMRITVTFIMIVASLIAIAIRELLDAAFIFAGFYVVIAIPAIATALKPNIQKHTVTLSLIGGLIMVSIFVPFGLLINALSPMLSVQIMAGSFLGLIIGASISQVRKRFPLTFS